MAHEIIELMARTLESKRKDRETQEVLREVYTLVDEYNTFVKTMDAKFDAVILKMESLINDGH